MPFFIKSVPSLNCWLYLNGPKRFLNFPDCLQIILSERLALHLQIVVRMSIPHDLEKHPTVHPNTVLEPRFGLLIILPNCSKLCHDNICPASVTNIILYTWLSRETNPRPETWCGVVGRTQRSVKCENVRIQRKGPARFQLFQDFKTQLTSSRIWWKCHSQQSFITFTFLRKLPTNTVSLASSNQS